MTLTRIVNTPVFDNLANAVKIIDSPHSEVHDGSAFHVSAYDLDLDSAAVVEIQSITEDTLAENDVYTLTYDGVTLTSIAADATPSTAELITSITEGDNAANYAAMPFTITAGSSALTLTWKTAGAVVSLVTAEKTTGSGTPIVSRTVTGSFSVLSITFKIPSISTKRMHFTANGDCTSGALFEVLEGPTITGSTGTNKTILNRDRDSENQSMVLSMDATANTVTVNAAVTHDGTIIEAAPLSAGKSKMVGHSRGEEEWLLKTNSLYTIRITGLADNGIASINLNWYEHTNILRPIGN